MPVRSPIQDVDIPLKDITTFFFEQAEARLDAIVGAGAKEPPLLIDGKSNSSLLFSDIKRIALKIACALESRGFPGNLGNDSQIDGLCNTVAVFSPSDIHFSAIHFGALMAGAAYMPLDPSLEGPVLAQRLSEVNTKAVFVAAQLLPTLMDTCEQGGVAIPKENIIIIRGQCSGYLSLEDIVNSESETDGHFTPQAISGDETRNRVALVIYSSGTTGAGKGVMLTHHNIVAMYTMVGGYSARSQVHDKQSTSTSLDQSHILSALPLWLLYGTCVLCYQPLATGDCVVHLPGFDASDYLGSIERYSINRLSSTPYVLYKLMQETEKADHDAVAIVGQPSRSYNIGSVKAIGCGGAFLPPHLLRAYSDFFNGAPIIQGYGQTESSSIIAGSSWAKPVSGAVGILYPNSLAKVIDESGQETSGFGELCIQGPHVMKGYTNKAVKSPIAGGYLHTGDYVKLSPDGHVFLKGRIVDIIHTADGLVMPSDVENHLVEHPDIKDCAVVGTGAKGNAQPVAFVVLPQNAAGSLSDIEKWVHGRTGISVECRIVQSIPKSHAGKVLRYMLH